MDGEDGEDGLNSSSRINTRIKRKLTFFQVSCDHKKTKTVLLENCF